MISEPLLKACNTSFMGNSVSCSRPHLGHATGNLTVGSIITHLVSCLHIGDTTETGEMIRDDLTQGRPAARQTPTKTATRLGAKQALPTKNVSCQSIGLLACTCCCVWVGFRSCVTCSSYCCGRDGGTGRMRRCL